MSIGEKIKELRTKEKRTQVQVADASGLHWNAVARIERGDVQPSFAAVVSLLRGLGYAFEVVRKR